MTTKITTAIIPTATKEMKILNATETEKHAKDTP
jgi:hypothetical protein